MQLKWNVIMDNKNNIYKYRIYTRRKIIWYYWNGYFYNSIYEI